jgi:hypothetical protein
MNSLSLRRVAVGLAAFVTVAAVTALPMTQASAAAATHMVFTVEPTAGTGGGALTPQPTVSLEDGTGAVDTTDTTAVTMTITGGTGTAGAALSTCTATTVAGVAAFSGCSINLAGTGYTLTATNAGGLPDVTSSAFNVSVGTASQLAFTTQPGNGTGGSALAPQPTVTIQDAGGNTVTTDTNAVTMTIGANPSTGVLSTCASTTTAGVAAFTGCSINRAGTGYTLTATDTLDAGITQTSTAFNVTVGTASQLAFSTQPGNGTGGSALAPQPTVTIEDAGGNTVTTDTNAVTMAIGTNPSTGVLSTCTSTTTAGVAAFTGCSINKAGTGYTLAATDGTDLLTHASTPFNVTVGAVAHLVFTTQPGNGTGGSALAPQPTVTIEDAGGNTVTTDTNAVTMAIGTNPSTGVLTTCTSTTTAGVAAFTGCTINKAGTGYTLTATDTSDALIQPSTAFNVTVGPVTQLAFSTQPAGASGGTAFATQPVVVIQDAGGNTVTTDTHAVTMAIGTNPSTGVLTTCTSTTTAGVAAFTGCTINKVGTGYTLTATDTLDAGLTHTSTAFNVIVGAPAQLIFTVQPGNSAGGAALAPQPTVTIDDAGGNTVPADTNAIAMTIGTNPSAGTLSTCAATTAGGVAAFTGCSINKAGTGYTLTATDATDVLTHTSSAFNVTVGPASQLAFTTQPGNGLPGTALAPQPTVTIQDAGGNTVTTNVHAVTMTIGTNPSAGTLSTCTSTTTAGVAPFAGCTINNAGTAYTLTATDTTDTLSHTSNAFNVNAFTVSCAPTGLVAVANTGSATLSWTAPSCNGGSAVTGYRIFQGSSIGGESTTPVNGTLDSMPSYSVNGLTNGTTYYFTVQAVNGVGASTPSNEASATPIAASPNGGYWEVASDGGVFSFGNAGSFGSAASLPLNHPVVGLAPTHDRQGYWLVASDGGIFNYGDAHFFGSTGGMTLNKPIVGMAATTDGGGYWLVASDGGIFAYGDAHFSGSTGGMTLNKPIVGMAVTPDGGGYWLVASDGGIFAYGDAHFSGSTGGMTLNKPVVGMAANPGGGYWLVASDGGIFNYGRAAFEGSTGGTTLNKPVVGMSAAPDGAGYWLVASDGGIFNYGSAGFFGSTGGMTLNKPVIGMG